MPHECPAELSPQIIHQAIESVCGRIPPLWPLQNFVAVNPFLGLTERTFEDAARLIDSVGHGPMLMPADYYLSRCQDEAIGEKEISAAYTDVTGLPSPERPASWLKSQLELRNEAERFLTVADWIDRSRGTNWASFITDELSKWCSSYFDRGQSQWSMAWRSESLYRAWKRAASVDRNPELHGLPEFRSLVRALPESEDAAIRELLFLLGVPEEEMEGFLHRQLMSVYGWSAWCAYQERQGSANATRQLLAIRLAYDAALLTTGSGNNAHWKIQAPCTFTLPKYVAQIAAERTFRSALASRLASVSGEAPRTERKRLQAVFCIDVRSEKYRRALEAQAEGIETIGFAGFFGMALQYMDSARCPVLIAPRIQVKNAEQETERDWLSGVWSSLRNSASGCFSSVEIGGLGYGFAIAKRLRGRRDNDRAMPALQWELSLEARANLAADALRNMSIDPRKLAPVVLICGHGSKTENNPYGSSLDCGACGGHKGDVNARFAAALMNDPEVREELKRRDVWIPADTVFVAGLHITTTDEVVLYDTEVLTPAQLGELKGWLRNASRRLEGDGASKSRDWSEVRPEWGLAGNAAFIAAPRWRTRSLQLDGRAFLHDYDAGADPDGAVLNLILTAPVVVASWINLQYYGSTVNNELFGSGNKVLHNVAGTFGIWEGNAGDLRTGLPMQSLHDGTKWVHEPLRLQVFVEAPRVRIDGVLSANEHVRQLVENDWISLHAMEGEAFWERRPGGHWRRVEV